MATVTVRPVVKRVNHVESCKARNCISCPREYEDGKWEYDFIIRWPSGEKYREQRFVPLPVGASRKKAEAWAQARYDAIVKKGEETLKREKEDEEALTVSQFEDGFFKYQTFRKKNRQKAATGAARKGIFKNHIVPLIGETKLNAVTLGDLLALKEKLEEDEYAEKTRNNILCVFSSLMKAAFALGHIQRLPFDKVGITNAKRTTPPDFYDDDEIARLLLAAMEDSERSLYPLLLTGLDAGLRSGELRALAPYDFKWGTGTLTIARQEWNGIVDLPKGGKARTVPVTGRLKKAVQALGRVPGDRIFVREDGKPWTAKSLMSAMKRLQRRAGLRPDGKIHTLRHTFCTRLAARPDVSPRTIQELAGHEHISTTEQYMHVRTGAQEHAIALLDDPVPVIQDGKVLSLAKPSADSPQRSPAPSGAHAESHGA
jgi:integrase